MNERSLRGISAVVRTWNSAPTLARTLRSLGMQNEAIAEIIIVDSGSTDATRQIANRFHCRWIDYPAEKEFNYSDALNLGIATSRENTLLIISSHTVLLYRDILAMMLSNLLQHGAAGVYCAYTRSRASLAKGGDPMRGKAVEVTRLASFRGYNGLSNSCSLIRKECWERHPFEPTMPSAEDQEWALWFYRNTTLPTVRIGNAGVFYLNPHFSLNKEVREHVVIASRLLPALRSWSAIVRMYRGSMISALRGHGAAAGRDLASATGLLKSRFRSPRFTSRYYQSTA